MTIVNRHLVDELHAEGWHLVTTREWYEMQARLAALERVKESAQAVYQVCHKNRAVWCQEEADLCAALEAVDK